MCCKNRARHEEAQALIVAPSPGQLVKETDNTSQLSQPPSYKAVMRADRANAQLPQAPEEPILIPSAEAQAAPLSLTEAEKTCLALGGHDEKRKYGAVGIIAGIVFFPWGLFWTRCDSSVVCRRCRTTLQPNHCARDRHPYQYQSIGNTAEDENFLETGVTAHDSCRGCRRARRHHRRHCHRHYQAC